MAASPPQPSPRHHHPLHTAAYTTIVILSTSSPPSSRHHLHHQLTTTNIVAFDLLRDALSAIFGLSELKEINRHGMPRMHLFVYVVNTTMGALGCSKTTI
ncbi:hypothetical protein Tco_1320594 [Tanacetum coccineum]